MKQSVIIAKFNGENFDKDFTYENIKNSMSVIDETVYIDRKAARRAVYKLIRQLRKVKGAGDAPSTLTEIGEEIRKWDGGEIKDGDSDMNTATGNAWIFSKGEYWVLCRHDIPEKTEEPNGTVTADTEASVEQNIEKVFSEIGENMAENGKRKKKGKKIPAVA